MLIKGRVIIIFIDSIGRNYWRTNISRSSLRTHPDRVPADSPERPTRTRQFQYVNDAYYTLSDPERRREYDTARSRFRPSATEESVDEEVPHRGAGSFPWSTFGFGGSEQERQGRDSQQFGSIFEEMLREEGLAGRQRRAISQSLYRGS